MSGKAVSSYSLRLPRSIRAAVARVSKQDGTSVNQFVNSAIAEKLAAMDAVTFFSERRKRADLKAFDRITQRKSGQKPVAGDEA